MEPREHLDSVMSGYQESLILLVAAKAGLFEALAADPRGAEDLAGALGLDSAALGRLLLALTAHGYLRSTRGDRFEIHPDYAPFLRPESDQTLLSILKHHHHCFRRWRDLEEVLQTGKPSATESSYADDTTLRNFICGMENISRQSTLEVAQKVDLGQYRRMLDLGGGPGTASIVLARNFPSLHCVVFDLPEVTPIATEQIAAAGLTDRITTRSGDFEQDELGADFDLVYISNIIHSLAPDRVAELLAKAYRALELGGAVMVKDFFLDESLTRPAWAARFSVHMLVSTEGGRSYGLNETRDQLAACGFSGFRTVEIGKATRVLMATKI